MAKDITILADKHREEHYKSLIELSDRDLCETIRAHFESHPTLPGEKVIKDEVNQRLAQLDNQSQDKDNLMTYDEKENLARKYAQTRIRETPLKEGLYYLDPKTHEDDLIQTTVGKIPQGNSTIYVNKVNVTLEKSSSGDVSVMAETWLPNGDETHSLIGHLPDKFLINNPMIVDVCDAEMQLVDYSNGKGKNLSAKIVVNTDLMSGDVIDLNDDMLSGLNLETELSQ